MVFRVLRFSATVESNISSLSMVHPLRLLKKWLAEPRQITNEEEGARGG